MAKNTVVVSVLADTKNFANAMGGTDSTFKKFAKGAAVVATAAGAIAVAVGVKAVRSASDLEQAMGGMESVFKAASGQMTEYANNAASTVGLAKSEYASLSTVLGAQLKNMGVPMSELAGQTNDLVGLGADLAAQFGGSTSDAVSALSSLLRGERDPIERYGVSINEAAVKAKLAEMGLSGLTGEAEKNAKLQATLALLTQQTADAQGAFGRESTTLAGAQQRLNAGTENLYATLGTALLPAVTAVTAGIGELVNRMQSSEWFAAFTENITGASNAFADFIFGILNGEQELDFSALLAGLLPAITTGIQTAAAWLAGGGLQPILASIATGRDGLLQAAITLFTSIAQALPQILPALVTALIDSLPIILPVLVTAIIKLVPTLISTIIGMVPKLLGAAVKLFTALVTAIPKILPALGAALLALAGPMVSKVKGIIPKLVQAGRDLIGGLVRGLQNAAGRVTNMLLGIARNAINAFKNFFGIQSPSRLMDDMGVFIDKGLAGGIGRGLRHVRSAVRKLNSTVTDEFDADLTSGTLTLSGSRSSAGASAAGPAQRVYNITIQAVTASAEVGRAVVDAIAAYERTTNSAAPGALA